jgi:hypothetical protein
MAGASWEEARLEAVDCTKVALIGPVGVMALISGRRLL